MIAAVVGIFFGPALVVGIGWLAIKVAGNLGEHIELSANVSISADPAIAKMLILIGVGVWGAFVGAYPNVFLHMRGDARRRPGQLF